MIWVVAANEVIRPVLERFHALAFHLVVEQLLELLDLPFEKSLVGDQGRRHFDWLTPQTLQSAVLPNNLLALLFVFVGLLLQTRQ